MITLHGTADLRPSRSGIWLFVCLATLGLALIGFCRIVGLQEGLAGIPFFAVAGPESRAPASCVELLGEDARQWRTSPTRARPLVAAREDGGSDSLWLGHAQDDAGGRPASYSSVWKEVELPADAETLTLAWSWQLQTAESAALTPGTGEDRQQALLLDADGKLLEVMYSSRARTSHARPLRHDLTAFAGETVRVYFNAYNDGDGKPTSLRLDDWSLLSCREAAALTDAGPGAGESPAAPAEDGVWKTAWQGFRLWTLGILAMLALAALGLLERLRTDPARAAGRGRAG